MERDIIINGGGGINDTSSAGSDHTTVVVVIPNSIPTLYALFILALTFVTFATAMSIYLIYQHLKYYTQPEHQRYIVRIVFMIPIYGIYSLLCLALYDYVVYFSLFRDCYEAYALYMFFALCVRYGGGDKNLNIHFMSLPLMNFPFPFTCITFKPSESFLQICRMGILQYVIVRPIVSLVSAILEMNGLYDDSHFSFNRFHVYSFLLNNVSVTVALFILLLFYQAAKEELAPYKPLLKFTSIKIVIFFCFWQSIIIYILEKMSWLPSIDGGYTIGEVSDALNNFLICLEMFCISFLHLYAFPYELYRVRSFSTTPLVHNVQMGTLFKSVINSVSQRDMLNETMTAIKGSNYKRNNNNHHIFNHPTSSNSSWNHYYNQYNQINNDIEMGEFKSYQDIDGDDDQKNDDSNLKRHQQVVDFCDLMNTYNNLNIYDHNKKDSQKPLTMANHYGVSKPIFFGNNKSNQKNDHQYNSMVVCNHSILVVGAQQQQGYHHLSDDDFFSLLHASDHHSSINNLMPEIDDELDYSLDFGGDDYDDDQDISFTVRR